MNRAYLAAKLRGERIAWTCVVHGHRYVAGPGADQYRCDRPGCAATHRFSTPDELHAVGFDVD